MAKTIKLNTVRFCSNVLVFSRFARVIFVANNFTCQTPADDPTNRTDSNIQFLPFHKSCP